MAEKMWLSDWDGQPVHIQVHFKEPRAVTGITLYNYNASLELSYAGVCIAFTRNVLMTTAGAILSFVHRWRVVHKPNAAAQGAWALLL